MNHRFSLFFKINGWFCILAGGVLLVLLLPNMTQLNLILGMSAIYSGATFLIIDYVIQILFDCRNYLKQLVNQSGINFDSKSEKVSHLGIKESNYNNESKKSIWKTEIINFETIGGQLDPSIRTLLILFGIFLLGPLIIAKLLDFVSNLTQ